MGLTLSSHEALKFKAYYSPLLVKIQQGCSFQEKNVTAWSHSRSTVSLTAEVEHPEHPEEALKPTTGEPVREWDWMDVGHGVEGEGGGQIECLCAGLIMLSTEWAHITKDLLSLAGELLQSGNSARPFSLPGTQKMWPSSALVGWFKQQQTLYSSLSPSAYKAASVSGGRADWENAASQRSTFCWFPLHLCLLSSRYSNTVYLCSEVTPGYTERAWNTVVCTVFHSDCGVLLTECKIMIWNI